MAHKICVIIPIWGRQNIVDICLQRWVEIKKKYDVEVICLVSENWAKLMAFKHGLKFFEVSNNDLGNKMNKGVEYALKFKWDYLMNMGSDDLVSDELFELYRSYIDNKRPMFGLKKIVFFDTETKKAKAVDYGCMIGAGRMIRRDVLESRTLKGKEVDMYDKGISKCLDNNSRKRFNDVGMTEIDNEASLIIDIKSKDNIWSYDYLKGQEIPLESLKISDEYLTKLIEL